MGIRIIKPDAQITEILRFVKSKNNTVWYWCNLHTLQHNLVYDKRSNKKRKSNRPDPNFIVEFSLSAFNALSINGNEILRNFTKDKKAAKNKSLSQKDLLMDAAMQQCITAITHYKGNEDTKSLYLYSRVIELLWLQQENYLRSQKPQIVYVKTEYDKERIIFARDYLITHMDSPPTLIELAAIAGLNEFKLKKGFKELFDQTVFGYLAEVRLSMAGRALREKQKTVSRIAFELGYASPQHFSAAFKKKFGVPPAKY
jgi:AraC family transcriptional activator of pyochelin receptor